MSDDDVYSVDEQVRLNAHDELSRWLDRLGELAPALDDGESIKITFEGGRVGWHKDRALYSISVTRVESETL